MNDEKEKKYFIVPNAEVVIFINDDIITLSGETTLYWGSGDEETF